MLCVFFLDLLFLYTELSYSRRTLKLLWVIARIIIFLGFLYLFVCALSFLSSAFRLVGGIQAGKALNNHELLQNPVAALMIGVLVTVLVQSSSTSTSITVALVGSGLRKQHYVETFARTWHTGRNKHTPAHMQLHTHTQRDRYPQTNTVKKYLQIYRT